jgi:hypothetical protein
MPKKPNKVSEARGVLLAALAREGANLNRADYQELLEELRADIDARLECVEAERSAEEE